MSDRRGWWLGGLLLALMTFAAYAPAIRGGFIWDDERYVSENPLMTVRGGLGRIWTLKATDQYYPLVYSSFWLERRLWGLDPAGYHAVNVLLHVLNVLLVWFLLRRLGLQGAWFAAAIFALHPVHVESVAWISERKNVMSGLFYLLALASYLNFEETKKRSFYFTSLGLFVLALLSKTVTCTLPVIILLLGWMRGRQLRMSDVTRLAPFFALGVGAGLLTSWVETTHAGAHGPDWDLNIQQRLMLPGKTLCFYAGKLAWPSRLCFNYERWELDPHDLLQWSGDILALGCAFLVWRGRERLGRGAVAGGAFFILTLFPALGFFKIFPQRYSYVADHFQYLASLGLIAIFVGGVSKLVPGEGRLPAGALAALLPLLGILTWRQGHIYKDLDSLWADTLKKNPKSFMARTNTALALFARGKVDEALVHYRAALALKPDLLETRSNLGIALASQGKWDEAIEEYRAALTIAPNYVDGHARLGLAFKAKGRLAEAMEQYQEALKYNPRYVNAYINMGDVLLIQERNREAAAFYARVLWINENLPAAAYNNAGYAIAAAGDYAEAVRHFREALRIEPVFVSARVRLGDALAMQGKTAQALAEYREATRLDPANAEAKEHAARALKMKPIGRSVPLSLSQ